MVGKGNSALLKTITAKANYLFFPIGPWMGWVGRWWLSPLQRSNKKKTDARKGGQNNIGCAKKSSKQHRMRDLVVKIAADVRKSRQNSGGCAKKSSK